MSVLFPVWLESTTYSHYHKAMVAFQNPFWDDRGAMRARWKTRRHELHVSGAGASVGYSPYQRARAGLDCINRNSAEGARDGRAGLCQMIKYKWVSAEYSEWGCPYTLLTLGVLDLVGGNALRARCGNMLYAGTETAEEDEMEQKVMATSAPGGDGTAVELADRAPASVIGTLN
ncbi:hypothetical protein S7711_04512, partial [Stachybotrys chartarum IBT 7711]